MSEEKPLELLDWNELSKRGLIRRINTEILHPLGLAMNRVPETGISTGAYVSPDGLWEYPVEAKKPKPIRPKKPPVLIIRNEKVLNRAEIDDYLNS